MTKVNRRVTPVKKEPRDFSKLKALLRYLKLMVTTSLVTVLLGGIGFYSWQAVQTFLKRPIAEIVINGNFNYVDREKLSLHVKELIGQSFISKNIEHIQADIQSIAWVDSVSLARKWPDQLTMTISEHSPIARWSDIGFVNIRGQLIATDELVKVADLPELNGKKTEVADVMREYSVLAKALQPYDMKISYLEKYSRGAWQVVLDNNWQIILGRGEALKKINRLTQLLDQQLLTVATAIDVIDIRYPNGMSIKWNASHKEGNQEDQTKKKAVSAINNGQTIEISHTKKMAHTRG